MLNNLAIKKLAIGEKMAMEEISLRSTTKCPLCGAFVPNSLSSIKNETIETELKHLVDAFGGLEIFSEENASRFTKALAKLSSPFDVVRDKLLIANIRNVPQKLYSVLESVQSEQQRMVDQCFDELMSLGIQEKFAEEVISWIVNILQMPVSVERKVIIEKKLDEKVLDLQGSCSGLHEMKSRYRTCVIGTQEWLAENFHEKEILSEHCHVFVSRCGKDCSREEFGRLYDWYQALYNAPKGWHLPTIEDYQDLVSYIQSLGFDSGTALKSTSQWHGTANQGLDLFGFCAYPTEKDKETGETQAWFWTSSETNKMDYPYYCVSLRANNNALVTTSRANTGYHACVRYVRDVE